MYEFLPSRGAGQAEIAEFVDETNLQRMFDSVDEMLRSDGAQAALQAAHDTAGLDLHIPRDSAGDVMEGS